VTKIHFIAYQACVLKTSNKACQTGYPYPDPVPAEKHFLDIRIQLKTYYPAGYTSGKPDSDHLWCVEHSRDEHGSGQKPIFFFNLADQDWIGLRKFLLF